MRRGSRVCGGHAVRRVELLWSVWEVGRWGFSSFEFKVSLLQSFLKLSFSLFTFLLLECLTSM